MATNFVPALKAEIAELEDELRRDPRHRKLARLRETLAEYDPASKGINVQLATGSLGIATGPATLQTKGDRIKAEIMTLLQQRGALHRKEILNHLEAVGLMGNEKDPMASLAAYFSGWRDIFKPDGAGNWSLSQELRNAE
jgi:hypothetical protein